MFHFTRADSKSQRAKSAVRGGMAVAADHRHAWLRQAQLRPDHMDHALPVAANAETAKAEFGAVGFQLRELFGGDLVDDGQRAVGGRYAVIGRGNGEIGTPDLQPALAQALKSLRRSDFMNQVQIDVEQRRSAGMFVDYVRVPEFFYDGAWHKYWGQGPGHGAPTFRLPYFGQLHTRRARTGIESDSLRQRSTDWARIGGVQQLVFLHGGQFTVQIDFIVENNLVGMAAVDAHLCLYGTKWNRMVIRIHPHRDVHATRQSRCQQVMWPEAGMLPAFVGGDVGDPLMFTVGKPSLVSGRLASGADHFSILAGVRQVYGCPTSIVWLSGGW